MRTDLPVPALCSPKEDPCSYKHFRFLTGTQLPNSALFLVYFILETGSYYVTWSSLQLLILLPLTLQCWEVAATHSTQLCNVTYGRNEERRAGRSLRGERILLHLVWGPQFNP